MIYDLLNTYKDYFKDDKVVLDSYRLQDGIYILFKNDGTNEVLQVDKNTNQETPLYEYIKIRDFYSNYIESNKALDTSYSEKVGTKEFSVGRKICSNNQYTLFFKARFVEGIIKDSIEAIPVNIFLKGIDKYFESMTQLGKNDKRTEMILEKISHNVSTEEEILKNQEIMKSKFIEAVNLLKEYCIEKDIWIKIFFEADVKEYERASLKYTFLKIFNKNDENILNGNEVYGINNYNFGYTTTKKPFTELKSTSFKIGSMVSLNDIRIMRNIYMWLLKQVSTKDFVKIPLSYNFCRNDDLDKIPINGEPVYLLSVNNNNGAAEVKNFEYIPFYSQNMRAFKCSNYFNTKTQLEEIEFVTKNIYYLETKVSKLWFSNSLRDSYFNFDDKVSKKTMISTWKKNCLKKNANIFLEFFHKSNSNPLKYNLDKIAIYICYKTLLDEFKDGKTLETIKAMNLWISFDEYFGGDFKMIKDDIFEKSKDIVLKMEKIDSEPMYFFMVGQVVKYLLDRSKSGNKNQSMIDPVMKAGTKDKLISVLLAMRDKYSYSLLLSNPKFDNIFKQILMDETKMDIVKNKKYILVGFLEDNLFYIKSNELENKSENV